MLSIAVDRTSIMECDSYCQYHDNQGWIYWGANGAEMFHNHISVTVCKYLQANLAILFEMTGLKVDKKSSLRAFSTGKFKSCFRWMDKKKIISFLFLFFCFFFFTKLTLRYWQETRHNSTFKIIIYLRVIFFGRIQKRICDLRSYEFFRGNQLEYSSKPLKHSIVKHILAFKLI